MNAYQIEKNVTALVENFNKEEFVFDLLKSYGISKTSITRLKKGDFNLSKVKGEVLYKSKMLFKEVVTGKLLDTIDELTKNEDSLKHNPRFVIVTDYKTLLAKDIGTGRNLDIPILEIHKHFGFFLPWAGQEKYAQKNENDADRRAAYKMAKLYDILVAENKNIYVDGGHNLNIFLSRLLFCFFAEDTNIFPVEGMFTDRLIQYTKDDGSDVHTYLKRLFKILNKKDNSQEPSHLKDFPYVNGDLFNKTIKCPKFNKEARKIVKECGELRWNEINPDIFGSMIQAVVNPDPEKRSGLGMHYTSVPNIMKVIEPLFLNELNDEFEKAKGNESKLRKLIYRISNIKIFDPACGSGNFLIITYKELRRLEIDILDELNELNSQTSIVFTQIKLSQFYGIELDDFAHEMAILSLWLAEHQMNQEFENDLYDFGRSKPILPLKEAGHIIQGNATRIDWKTVCPIDLADEVYILGNPPYYGARLQDENQKQDMNIVFYNVRGYNNMDYIASWFYKAKNYIEGFNSKCAFVSTNSICQGEQVALLWPNILNDKIEIGFAHESFKWTNNAKGNAGVIVIIVGLRNKTNKEKFIYIKNIKKKVNNINSYLVDAENIIVHKRSKPISNLPEMCFGSMPNDGGFLTSDLNGALNDDDKEKFIKPLVGGSEFIKNIDASCIWINKDKVDEALTVNFIKDRISKVKKYRLKSNRKATRELASVSYRFGEVRHQETESIIVPATSSERRNYIPIGFLPKGTVIKNSAQAIYNAQPWIFGVISSNIHMIWLKNISGKLKTDYRYSSALCYNTFPFPKISQKQKQQINLHAFDVLEEREKHSGKNLAQLYDPDKMPKGLKEAHHQLDLAIERCYRLKPFESDTERLEYLFKEYEKMINKNTLLEKPKRTRKKKA